MDAIVAILFAYFAGPAVIFLTLILGVIPTLVEYRQKRHDDDLMSLRISLCALVSVLTEVVALGLSLKYARFHGPGG